MTVSRGKSEIHLLTNNITSLFSGVFLAARTHNSSRKRKKEKKSYFHFVSEHTTTHISARFGADVCINLQFRRVVGS